MCSLLTNGGSKVYMKRSFGAWNANLKYDFIVLWRVAYLVGYNFVIHFICHTPKKSFVLFLFLAKHSVLHCVFFGLSKNWINGYCFPKTLLSLFKGWILVISPPASATPPTLLFTSYLPPYTHNSLGSIRESGLGKKWRRLGNIFINNLFKYNWEKGWEVNLLPSFPPWFLSTCLSKMCYIKVLGGHN